MTAFSPSGRSRAGQPDVAVKTQRSPARSAPHATPRRHATDDALIAHDDDTVDQNVDDPARRLIRILECRVVDHPGRIEYGQVSIRTDLYATLPRHHRRDTFE